MRGLRPCPGRRCGRHLRPAPSPGATSAEARARLGYLHGSVISSKKKARPELAPTALSLAMRGVIGVGGQFMVESPSPQSRFIPSASAALLTKKAVIAIL